MPSLHAAFSLLVAVTLWPRKHKWLRPIVALYPLAMGFSLVYTGEHYVSDILLGWLYTIASVAVGALLIRWWAARRAERAPAAAALARGKVPPPCSRRS